MTPAALLFASFSLSAVFADLTGAIGVSDTSQATVSPSPVRDGQTWDLETVPLVQLSLAWPESTLTLGYGPRLLLRDAFENDEPTLLHLTQATYRLEHHNLRAGLAFTYVFGKDSITAPGLILPNAPATPPLATDATAVPADATAPPTTPGPEPLRVTQSASTLGADISYTIGEKRLTLTLAQAGELQEQTLAGAVLGTPAIVANTPTTGTATGGTEMVATTAPSNLDLVSGRRIRTGSETSAATLDYKWSPTLHSSLLGSYRIAGGLGDRAELLLPLQRTAFAGVAVHKAVSPRDELTTDLNGTETEVVRGPDSMVLILTETWRRQWSPYVSSSIGAGVAVTNAQQLNSDERTTGVEPTANGRVDATVWRAAEAALLLHAGTSIAPTVNPLTGNLQTRVAGDAGAALNVEHTEITADGDVVQTLPSDEPDATRVIGASTGVAQEIGGVVFLSARYRSVWQNVGDVNAMTSKLERQWSAVFAVTLIGPVVTF